MKMKAISNFNKLILISLWCIWGQNIYAQSKSYGNLIIENKGELKLSGAHIFLSNNSIVNKGILGTERSSSRGFICFMPNSTCTGMNDNAYVDGYVKSYISTEFTFPIGDNSSYRPIKISNSSANSPTDAAYFGVNPSTAITSPFFGNKTEILPFGGPFNANTKEIKLSTVSTKEYWDINGLIPAKITLSWDINSSIAALTSNALINLVICGWDGTKWVEIPSTIDATSLFGTSSTFNSGSITTNSTLIPNTYSVYSFGALFANKTNVFSSKITSKIIAQTQTINTILPFNANIIDTNLIVTISHSNPMFGTLSNTSNNGYTYIASNIYIGVDTIKSVAKIVNKQNASISYDTFINETFVKYYKADTTIDMGFSTMATFGKNIIKTQNLGYRYNYKSKHGVLDNFNSATFRYQSPIYNKIDTLIFYFEVNYSGLLTTMDSTRYIIKLAKGINSISNNLNENFSIQNLIKRNHSNTSQYWILPKDLMIKYPNIQVQVSSLDGKIIYQSSAYKNDWPSIDQTIAPGIYAYQLLLDDETSLKGILQIQNE